MLQICVACKEYKRESRFKEPGLLEDKNPGSFKLLGKSVGSILLSQQTKH